MEDIEYQKKQVDTYKMFLKIREEQAKKEKYKNYSQDGLIDELLEKQEENEQMEATIQSNIKSYNKLAEYSKELEDRIDELNNLNEKISLALESSEYRLDKAIKYVESLSSKGRGCDIYDDIKKEILRKLKGEKQ